MINIDLNNIRTSKIEIFRSANDDSVIRVDGKLSLKNKTPFINRKNEIISLDSSIINLNSCLNVIFRSPKAFFLAMKGLFLDSSNDFPVDVTLELTEPINTHFMNKQYFLALKSNSNHSLKIPLDVHLIGYLCENQNIQDGIPQESGTYFISDSRKNNNPVLRLETAHPFLYNDQVPFFDPELDKGKKFMYTNFQSDFILDVYYLCRSFTNSQEGLDDLLQDSPRNPVFQEIRKRLNLSNVEGFNRLWSTYVKSEKSKNESTIKMLNNTLYSNDGFLYKSGDKEMSLPLLYEQKLANFRKVNLGRSETLSKDFKDKTISSISKNSDFLNEQKIDYLKTDADTYVSNKSENISSLLSGLHEFESEREVKSEISKSFSSVMNDSPSKIQSKQNERNYQKETTVIIDEFGTYQKDLVKMMNYPILADMRDPKVSDFSTLCEDYKISMEDSEIITRAMYVTIRSLWKELLSYADITQLNYLESVQRRKIVDARVMMNKALDESSSIHEKEASVKALQSTLNGVLPLNSVVIDDFRNVVGLRELST